MEKLVLPIDCIMVDGTNPELAGRIINHVNKRIKFNKVKLLSFQRPHLDKSIEFVNIPKLDYIQYATFCLKYLHLYVESDFCMSIQTDGYPYNNARWKDYFLLFDYIGGPWELGTAANARVGNSGFCIRSKKLLERLTKSDIFHYDENDDFIICEKYGDKLRADGFTFAHLETAAEFSWCGDINEIKRDRKECFGGHFRDLERLPFEKMILQ